MILRFLALLFREPYEEYMADFLNKYMGSNRNFQLQAADELIEAFVPTVELTHEAIGREAFRPRGTFNAAVFDAIMVGLAARLAEGPVEDHEALALATEGLLALEGFRAATETGTAHADSVQNRLAWAREAYREVP